MNKQIILDYLKTTDEQKAQELFVLADNARREYCGDGMFLRGLVEFSSHCSGTCAYCGLNKNNSSLNRYSMSAEEILQSAKQIHDADIKTIVLQSGDDPELNPKWLAEIIRAIKNNYDLSITISAGEKSREIYQLWRAAGADRYLLKIETTNAELYAKLHPSMSLQNRLRCLTDLQELGYQTGTGIIIGLPGQTPEIIAEDLLFFRDKNFDMLGIGPLIPHQATELKDLPRSKADLTLRCVALARILTKNAHIPATTALGSLDKDYRPEALRAGANVLMPNFTPQIYKQSYEIYPGKRCLSEPQFTAYTEILPAGRYIDFGHGDSLKSNHG